MFNLANQLLRSLSGSLGGHRRSRRRNSADTGQQLEIRQVPTVTASLSAAGALTLTGDNTQNDITVEGNMATGFSIGEPIITTSCGNGGYNANFCPRQNTPLSEPVGHWEFEKVKQ